MIIEAIIMGLFMVVGYIIGWLPSLPLFNTLNSIIIAVAGVFGYLNSFVQVGDIIAVSMFCFAVDHVAFITRAVAYVKKVIPFL